MDLKYGTQNTTTASNTVATSVTIKPGVAGRRQPIMVMNVQHKRVQAL
jgi:hypothetical protein